MRLAAAATAAALGIGTVSAGVWLLVGIAHWI